MRNYLKRLGQFFNNVSAKRMALAVLFSLALHLLFFGGFTWHLPTLDDSSTMIEARLVQSAPPVLQEAKPVKVKAKPKPVAPAEPVVKKVAKPVKPEASPPNDNRDDNDKPTITDVGDPIPQSADAMVPPADESAPKPFRYVVTEFDAKRGQDATAAGSAKITYQALPNNRYLLRSEMQAKGLLALFIKQRTLISEGSVTEKGLQPDKFQYSVENNKEKSTSVAFDWVNKIAIFHTSKGEKKEPLPLGTQDLLSFMYQSMFVPPLNETRFFVANARNIREYDYEFAGEEIIETKIGKINTLHLHRVNEDGDEAIDLWLAPDYLYLPVKILQISKKGTLELFITSIKSDAAPATTADSALTK